MTNEAKREYKTEKSLMTGFYWFLGIAVAGALLAAFVPFGKEEEEVEE